MDNLPLYQRLDRNGQVGGVPGVGPGCGPEGKVRACIGVRCVEVPRRLPTGMELVNLPFVTQALTYNVGFRSDTLRMAQYPRKLAIISSQTESLAKRMTCQAVTTKMDVILESSGLSHRCCLRFLHLISSCPLTSYVKKTRSSNSAGWLFLKDIWPEDFNRPTCIDLWRDQCDILCILAIATYLCSRFSPLAVFDEFLVAGAPQPEHATLSSSPYPAFLETQHRFQLGRLTTKMLFESPPSSTCGKRRIVVIALGVYAYERIMSPHHDILPKSWTFPRNRQYVCRSHFQRYVILQACFHLRFWGTLLFCAGWGDLWAVIE